MGQIHRTSIVSVLGCMAALVAIWATAVPASARQADAQLLKAISGVWEGRGVVQRSASAAAEPVSCRFEAGLADNGLALDLSYVCLGIDLRFETTGTLTVNSDRFTVSLYTAGTGSRVEGTGERNGQTIVLALEARHPETGEPVSSQLTITLNGPDTLANALRATDPDTGESFSAFEATLSR